jgi:putative peptidoglycan lipid II flippase
MYAVGTVFVILNPFLLSVFHAIRDTKTPAFVSVVSVGLSIVLNIVLINPFKHMGLAFSTRLAALAMTGMLLFFIRKRIGPLKLFSEKKEWAVTMGATAAMGAAVGFGYRHMPVMSASLVHTAVCTIALIVGGMTVYFLFHYAFKTVFMADCVKLGAALYKTILPNKA